MRTYTDAERYAWIEACHVKIEPARLPEPGRRANHLNRVMLPGLRTPFAHIRLSDAVDAAMAEYPDLTTIIAAAKTAALNGSKLRPKSGGPTPAGGEAAAARGRRGEKS